MIASLLPRTGCLRSWRGIRDLYITTVVAVDLSIQAGMLAIPVLLRRSLHITAAPREQIMRLANWGILLARGPFFCRSRFRYFRAYCGGYVLERREAVLKVGSPWRWDPVIYWGR